MPEEFRQFTRQELYDLVWSQPMTKVALEFGMSNVGAKKICRKHGIPVPGRGYWRKLERGKKGVKIPLPRQSDERTITIAVRGAAKEHPMEEPEVVAFQKAFEAKDENRIHVAERLDRPHPLTALTKKRLLDRKPDDYGMLKCGQPEVFSFRIGPQSVDRAMRILDAFLKALEKRGFKLVFGTNEHKRTHVLVNGEPLMFSIDEPTERHTHRITREEKARRAKGQLWYIPNYDYVPTGNLTLKIATPYSSGIRGAFGDNARKKVEDLLNDAILSMVQSADWEKRERQRLEEKQRRLDQENARRTEIRRQQHDETARLKKLHEDAQAWHSAEALRQYIAATDKHACEIGRAASPEHLAWLRWATAQADRLDPLRESPQSVLDDKAPELLGLWQLPD